MGPCFLWRLKGNMRSLPPSASGGCGFLGLCHITAVFKVNILLSLYSAFSSVCGKSLPAVQPRLTENSCLPLQLLFRRAMDY